MSVTHNIETGGVDYLHPVGDTGAHDDTKPPPSWLEWCERNSKPVVRTRPKEERELTPWQKKGPMKKKQWKHFFAWAEINAAPVVRQVKGREPPPCEADYLPCAKKKREDDDGFDAEAKLVKLATPYPRSITKKFDFKPDEPTYSPAIVWGKPPHRDKGRPFEPPQVPCCFANDELEDEFWSNLRFPIRKEALNGRPTPRIVSLAKPKEYPPFPHCPLPEKKTEWWDEKPQKRKKFTPRGWRLHQIRLIYLSKPVSRADYEYFYM